MSFPTFFAENRHRSYVVLLVNVPEHDHRFSDTATSKDPGVGREKTIQRRVVFGRSLAEALYLGMIV